MVRKSKIKSAFKIDKVLDGAGKEWICQCEVEKGLVVVEPVGYDSMYPFILSKDPLFVKNVKEKLYEVGIYNELEVDTSDAGNFVQFYSY